MNFPITPGQAVLVAGALISAAIFFRPAEQSPHYQIAPFSGIITRVNTVTGALELCGNVAPLLDLLMPMDEFMDLKTPQITDLIAQMKKAAVRDQCFEINNGKDHNRNQLYEH